MPEYNQKFIEAAVNVRNQNFIKRAWLWVIDSNTREAIRVSTFLKKQYAYKALCERIIKEEGWRDIEDYDYRMQAIVRWFRKNFVWVSDKVRYNASEKWADVDKVLTHWFIWADSSRKKLIPVHIGLEKPKDFPEAFRCDDCEGGATCIRTLAVLSGIPRDRVFLMAGDVVGGGHAWVAYISNIHPYVFKFIDWCYAYTGKGMKYRESYSIEPKTQAIKYGNPKYKKVWFFSTEEDTFIY